MAFFCCGATPQQKRLSNRLSGRFTQATFFVHPQRQFAE
jgi:hypothetical protein